MIQNTKITKIIIISIILVFVLLFVLLYILISNIFTIIYGSKIDGNKFIELFNDNQIMFEDVIEEIEGIKTIYIRKNHNSSYEVYIDNNKKIVDIKNNVDDYSNYKKSIDIMEKLNISYISKNYGNISFTMNSMFGLGQQIVYISDMDKYKYGNLISSIRNIKNNWYYVETK